jgi:hypothetical protein
MWMWVAVLSLSSLGGCSEANPLFCDGNADCKVPSRPYCDLLGQYTPDQKGHRCIGVPVDGGGSVCDTSADCNESATQPICDPSFGICLPCEDSPAGDAACLAKDDATPACSSDHRCVGCETGLDCPDAMPICSANETCGACEEGDDGNAACAARDPLAPLCLAGGCVECATSADCGSAEPVCDETTHECRPCGLHSECADEVCDPADGTCVPEGDIVYVARNGSDGSTCGGPTMACATVTQSGGALAKVMGNRTWIKLREGATPYNESIDIDTGGMVKLAGSPNVRVSPPSSSNTPGLLVTNGSNVTAMDIAFINATGGVNADGVRCDQSTVYLLRVVASGNSGNGVDVNSCTLARMERSTLHSNAAGGITIDDSGFVVRNNFIVNNGNVALSTVGGVDIDNAGAVGMQVFEFNTVAVNQTQNGTKASGVSCSTSMTTTAANNIVFGGLGDTRSHSGTCAWRYSDLEGSPLAGTNGNIDADPSFVEPSTMNYHLMDGSPCLGAADPNATLDIDFDGEPRAGPARDIGADER